MTALVRRLKKSGNPLVLTVNGRAELVVLDAVTYQRLSELVDRVEAVEGVRRGLESIAAGTGRSLDELDLAMRKKHKSLQE